MFFQMINMKNRDMIMMTGNNVTTGFTFIFATQMLLSVTISKIHLCNLWAVSCLQT